MRIFGRTYKGGKQFAIREYDDGTLVAVSRKLAFLVSTSIAAFARGTGPNKKLARREIETQKAFAAGALFVTVE